MSSSGDGEPTGRIPALWTTEFEYLKLAVDEEHFWHDQFEKRVAYYITLLSALLVGVVAGLINVETQVEVSLMAVGPLLLIVVAFMGQRGVYRVYQRFLEAVTSRIRLEEQAGLVPDDAAWGRKIEVLPRHRRARKRAKDEYDKTKKVRELQKVGIVKVLERLRKIFRTDESKVESVAEAFIEINRYGGSHHVARRLFDAFIVAGIILGIAIVVAGVNFEESWFMAG